MNKFKILWLGALIIGMCLSVAGIKMASAKKQETIVQDTREMHGVMGTGVGALSGIGLFLLVGGIGITIGGGGHKVGGIALALIGAVLGAMGGTASGQKSTIIQYAPIYSRWEWVLVLFAGIGLLCLSLWKMLRIQPSEI